jgi:PAS domain S-box-containing protein
MSTGIEQKAEYINPTFIKLFGYSIAEVPTVSHWWPLAYPDENYRRQVEEEWQEKVARAIATRSKIEPMETIVTCKDGSKKTMSWGFINIGKQNWASGLDLTERNKALDELKSSDERFRALHEASFGGVIIHDNALILDCNLGLSGMTGYTNDELIGMNTLQLIAPAYLDLVMNNMKAGYTERYEVEGIRKDGSRFPLSIQGKNIVYKDRNVRVVEFQDITRYKLAEKALRESEVRFRQIFDTNPDPVILAKLGGGAIIDVNKAFEALAGISRLEALGHNSLELGLWADKEMREPFLAQLKREGELNNFEADFRIKSGHIRTGLVSARLLSVNDEDAILIVIRDITSEKEAERAMVEMDRMKSEFISTAAHELSTPLSAMMGYTEFLISPEEFGGFTEGQKQDFLNEVYDRGEALNRIIDDLLDISRIESGQAVTLELQKTELADLLGKTVEFFRANEADNTFRLEIPDKPIKPEILIDRHRIIQVLENLLSNAVKYSKKGKEIVLKGQESDEGWVVQVTDQGIGMSPEQLDRVFDKFYRADASNTAIGGLGLGMSIARQIVQTHGGNIQIESIEGEGTTVTVHLPHTFT